VSQARNAQFERLVLCFHAKSATSKERMSKKKQPGDAMPKYFPGDPRYGHVFDGSSGSDEEESSPKGREMDYDEEEEVIGKFHKERKKNVQNNKDSFLTHRFVRTCLNSHRRGTNQLKR